MRLMASSDNPARKLLELMAEELDRLSGQLDRLYDEMFVGSAGGASTSLVIDGVPWTRVSDFDRSGPSDRHYAVSVSDDGQAIVLFGDGQRGQRPPAGAQLEVRYEPGKGAIGNVGKGTKGRVGKGAIAVTVAPDRLTLTPRGFTLAPRVQAPSTTKVYGIQRAVVVNAQDPQGRGRLQVQVPRVTGQVAVWALPCFAPSGTATLPAEGATCWVLYEDGDVDQPVWLGQLEMPARD